MENIDKELTVPKWVLIVQPKIPQMPQNISAQNVCQTQKFEIFEEKLSLGVRSTWPNSKNVWSYLQKLCLHKKTMYHPQKQELDNQLQVHQVSHLLTSLKDH